MEMLQYIIQHPDAASLDARVEIARIAIADDAVLDQQCRSHVARYAPDRLAVLPEMPGETPKVT